MHEKLIRAIARIIGAVWIVSGAYAIAAAFLSEHDRLIMLAIGVFFSGAGLWLIRTRNPFGALGSRKD